ncbi:MAG: BrnT family toxin [Candidatus Rokubacteria bacterium]|nr:BrnT family toxin [Candidatus Rokubacteria bacterium]
MPGPRERARDRRRPDAEAARLPRGGRSPPRDLPAAPALLVVAYAWRDDRIRIISARRATRRERRTYEG